ncbi:MAG: hypothetical protein U5L09_05660 [Bacteroidales bacterium]|nr:hypothetical protein [Bacteroidales bacterium]
MSDICKAYQVSNQAVYYWLNKYGIMKQKKERYVIETDSDSKALLGPAKAGGRDWSNW